VREWEALVWGGVISEVGWLPSSLFVVLASSTSGDQHFGIVRCADHQPIWIGDEQERLAVASPVMAKRRGENNYPESGHVKPPRRNTRALSPAGMFGGKAPLYLVAQKGKPNAPRAYAQFACLIPLQTGSTN
jgi:hypothetical protein